ncbi:MAG: hypothetical protein RLZZ495_1039 [Pseudomonadota bacterium]
MNHRLRWILGAGLVLMLVIGLGLLYLLTQATTNQALYEDTYTRLFTVNLSVAGVLFALIVWVSYRLWVHRQQGRFGSRLMVKLAAIFALVGLVPGVLIYVVSYQFVSRSIETWFDVKVEGALEAGLSLGHVTLDTLTHDLNSKTRTLTKQQPVSAVNLERVMEELDATDASLWNAQGKLLASAGASRYLLEPVKPTSTQLQSARTNHSLAWVDGLEEEGHSANAAIKVIVPLNATTFDLNPEQRFLMVSRLLPTPLVANALAVQRANREYQERALGRKGLQRMYIGTLTLSLVMAVFGAVLLALVLGDQIARPLVMLAQGVSQVAAGDLTPKMALQGNDELVGLTRAFASMTEQVADARRKVDTARAHLQAILDNLTAGVMVVDSDGKIRSANPGAAQILQCDVTTLTGRNLSEIEGLNQLEEFTEQGQEHFQRTIEIPSQHARSSAFDRPLALMVRGATLPSQERLLVFDDISDIVSAQRAQAWGEVARRLAHEIKNPLTPIQLSAERLERRLTGKLQEADQQVLTKSVKTIVEQVESMKRLVNDFRDYARLPSAQLQPVDLNALLVDVMQLYEYEGQQTLHIDWELDAQCPLIRGDAQQLRQVIHNIVQNAQDVSDKIVIRTVNRPASERVRLMVLDWGSGFPPDILKTAFEPYVTTKAKGTGLGLAVVKKIADEHAARIDISNRVEQGVTVGAQVSLSFAYHSQQAVATAA